MKLTKEREMEVLRRYVRRLLAASEQQYQSWLAASHRALNASSQPKGNADAAQ